MARRESAVVERAVRYYKPDSPSRGNVYRVAARFGIAPTTLYRALERNRKK